MKLSALIASVTLSLSVFAAPPAFNPKTTTCEEIQTAQTNYGSVLIQKRYLLGQKYFVEAYKTKPECPRFHYRMKFKVRTSEGLKCNLGYSCEEWSND